MNTRHQNHPMCIQPEHEIPGFASRNGGERVDTTVVSLDTHRIAYARRRSDHELEQHVAGAGNSSGSALVDLLTFWQIRVPLRLSGIRWAPCLVAAALLAVAVWACFSLDLSKIPSIHGLGR